MRFPNNPNTVFHIILLTPLLENNPTLQTGDWRWLTQLFTQYTQYALYSLSVLRGSTFINIRQKQYMHHKAQSE